MERDYSKKSIPDLRKKASFDEFDIKYLSIASCLVIGLILMLVIASILIVAGAPNSNFPNGY
jgi:hypothetical protein